MKHILVKHISSLYVLNINPLLRIRQMPKWHFILYKIMFNPFMTIYFRVTIQNIRVKNVQVNRKHKRFELIMWRFSLTSIYNFVSQVSCVFNCESGISYFIFFFTLHPSLKVLCCYEKKLQFTIVILTMYKLGINP